MNRHFRVATLNAYEIGNVISNLPVQYGGKTPTVELLGALGACDNDVRRTGVAVAMTAVRRIVALRAIPWLSLLHTPANPWFIVVTLLVFCRGRGR